MFYFLIKGKLHRYVHFVKVKLLKIYGASVFSVSVCISDIYIYISHAHKHTGKYKFLKFTSERKQLQHIAYKRDMIEKR